MTVAQKQHTAVKLSKVLADTYTLYLKTQNFHWNVTGPMFQTLHTMFEEQYTEMATAIDEIAERIRALGHTAPGSFGEFFELTTIQESNGHVSAENMIKELVKGHQEIINSLESFLKENDAVSQDLMIRRMEVHEKTKWMLSSLLEDEK